MNAHQHTPGPWRRDGNTVIDVNNGDRICVIDTLAMPEREAEAIGDLIAAAPELLDALRELVRYAPGEYFDDPRSDDEIDREKECAFAAARAAIAKATGGAA